MSWAFEFFSEKSAIYPIKSMEKTIEGLTSDEAAGAKLGHSDVQKGQARGTVIFNKSAQAFPGHDLKGPWKHQHWEADKASDAKYKQLLTQVCDFLDDLTEVEAAYAKFSVSDYKEGKCLMVIFWQRAAP
ncbi:MAG: hypothetical protein EOO71_01265 [Myxococcaceae bacterium]|nr:MAG: hypothetical protein EOO71_01265 [Myxococcaceae bacterium]